MCYCGSEVKDLMFIHAHVETTSFYQVLSFS